MESAVNENYNSEEKQPLASDSVHVEMSELDDSKAPIIDEKPESAMKDKIGVSNEKEFTGLTKDELMAYANNPYWTRLRLGLFILFWVAWIAMLAAAIIIIVLAPRCPHRPDHKWWQNEVIYQVYPQSFQDSKVEGDGNSRNEDGYGDLKGFESRLEYLDELKTKVIWMNSIFQGDEFGITNHSTVGDRFGVASQLKKIIKKMHKKGMKMVLDFIPNHTSRNHSWFSQSRDKKGKYADYYIWAPCTDDGGNAPNNWKNVYGGGAWTRDSKRKECYYHTFLDGQPDLNLRNKDVKEELENVIRFWLKLGVDGFHVCDAPYLVESEDLADEDSSGTSSGNAYDSLLHNSTKHQAENVQLFVEWRKIVSEFSKPGREKVFFTTMAGDVNTTLPYFGTKSEPGANFIPSKALYAIPKNCFAECYHTRVKAVLDSATADYIGGWQLGDENHGRFASAVWEPKVIKAVHTLQMLLPGTAINYYGDEIGLRNADVPFDQIVDPVGKQAGADKYKNVYRDQYRTPMRWDNTKGAGFTKGKPYLPLTPGQPTVQDHSAMFADESAIKLFKMLAKLRTEPSFRWGKTFWSVVDGNILSFVRHAKGFPAFLVVINFGNEDRNVMFTDNLMMLSEELEVVLHSSKHMDPNNPVIFNPHEGAIAIKSAESVVLKFTPVSK